MENNYKEYEEFVTEYSDDIEKAYIGFDKLVDKLKHKKNPPSNPEAVAAAIGKKKYGKEQFQHAAAKHKKMKKALEFLEPFQKSEDAPVETKSETVSQVETTDKTNDSVEVKKPQLAPGLFKEFTLGSVLKQGPVGNVMENVKTPMMDYNKQYESSTKNQTLTAEELEKLTQKK